MRNVLPGALDDRVTVEGRAYRLRPTVHAVLAAREALRDEALLSEDRARLAVWLLYRPPRPRPRAHEAAVKAAMDFLDEPPPYRTPPGSPRTLDIEQDADLVCAAILQQYGIEINRASADMDWRVFRALLSGIGDGTRLGEIMALRARKIPRRTRYNGEEIAELQKLKAIYALRPRLGGGNYDDALRRFAAILAGMAGTEGR